MVTEKTIPNYVIEDLLFRRRLERSLNHELERLYHLLVKQVELLRQREALISDVQAAVEQRCTNEDEAIQGSANSTTEESRQ
jgi:hypothetical protein